MQTKKIYLKNIVWKEGDYYVAQCLNNHVSSFGDSKQEALESLNEVVSLYFEDQEDLYKKIDEVEIYKTELLNA